MTTTPTCCPHTCPHCGKHADAPRAPRKAKASKMHLDRRVPAYAHAPRRLRASDIADPGRYHNPIR